uniref:Uncharacterized protein n=1 Tax=Timema monikensis TaxID=170555 RepID=A0A7R9E8K1_9NEOP|nr:unnamed protein product [Timema monikensis]
MTKGAYDVQPGGGPQVQDQSYRACASALLVFILLCLILILAPWLWKMGGNGTDKIQAYERSGEEGRPTTEFPKQSVISQPYPKTTKQWHRKSSQSPINGVTTISSSPTEDTKEDLSEAIQFGRLSQNTTNETTTISTKIYGETNEDIWKTASISRPSVSPISSRASVSTTTTAGPIEDNLETASSSKYSQTIVTASTPIVRETDGSSLEIIQYERSSQSKIDETTITNLMTENIFEQDTQNTINVTSTSTPTTEKTNGDILEPVYSQIYSQSRSNGTTTPTPTSEDILEPVYSQIYLQSRNNGTTTSTPTSEAILEPVYSLIHSQSTTDGTTNSTSTSGDTLEPVYSQIYSQSRSNGTTTPTPTSEDILEPVYSKMYFQSTTTILAPTTKETDEGTLENKPYARLSLNTVNETITVSTITTEETNEDISKTTDKNSPKLSTSQTLESIETLPNNSFTSLYSSSFTTKTLTNESAMAVKTSHSLPITVAYTDQTTNTPITTLQYTTHLTEVLSGRTSDHYPTYYFSRTPPETSTGPQEIKESHTYRQFQNASYYEYSNSLENTTEFSVFDHKIDSTPLTRVDIDDEREPTEFDESEESEYMSSNMLEAENSSIPIVISSTAPTISYDDSIRSTTNPSSSPSTTKTMDVMEEISPTIKETNTVCNSSECKMLASRMLSLMNHDTDRCEDFYEYACGGLRSNQALLEDDSTEDVWRRIRRYSIHLSWVKIPLSRRLQTIMAAYLERSHAHYMRSQRPHAHHRSLSSPDHRKNSQPWPASIGGKSCLLFLGVLGAHVGVLNPWKSHVFVSPDGMEKIDESSNSAFRKFRSMYSSCMSYEEINETVRVDQARNVLNEVGWIQNKTSWDFTQLIYDLLIRHSSPLFDVMLDVNGRNPSKFSLKLVTPVHKSFFRSELPADVQRCRPNSQKYDSNFINMSAIYDKYSECEVRHSLLSKEYELMTVDELQTTFSLVDWKILFSKLLDRPISPDLQVQVYFKSYFSSLFSELPHMDERILLAMFAHDLYVDLVQPRSPCGLDGYCLRVASALMEDVSSALYLNTYHPDELATRQGTMLEVFEHLRRKMGEQLSVADWMTDASRSATVVKLNNLTLAMDGGLSVFGNDTFLNQRLEGVDVDESNYFINAIQLQKKYRRLMYSVYDKDPSQPEQMSQLNAQSILQRFLCKWLQEGSMNIPFLDTVVPYAMTPSHPEDEAYPWFAKMADLGTLIARQISLHYDATAIPFGLLQEPFYHITYPRYTLMAGIGNVIAHEISHHFDNAGIQYGPEGKGSELLSKDNDEMTTYTLMEDCYSNQFTYSRNWTLPDERVVGLKLNPELSMNERIADQIALQLALEAYRDTNFGMTENVLPWLDMDKKQLYFLSLAQVPSCIQYSASSAQLKSSGMGQFCIRNLPIPFWSRVNTFLSNSNYFSSSFNCAEGTTMNPEYKCEAFPKLSA